MATTVQAAVKVRSTALPRDFLATKKGWALRPRSRCECCRAHYHVPLSMPALDSAYTQRAHESCQLKLCGVHGRERSDAGGTAQQSPQCWLTCCREAVRRKAQRRFSTLISAATWMDQVQVELECQVRRSAAANTTFKMASSDKPLENCASKGPPSIPLEAAARGVTSAGSAGPHRAPLAPTPCGWTDGLFSFLEARNYWFLTKDFKPRFPRFLYPQKRSEGA